MENKSYSEDIARHKLSALRALLGAITDNVRAVMLGWDDDRIFLKFITGNAPTEKDEENLSIAGTEILADFPSKNIVEEIMESGSNVNDLIQSPYRFLIFYRNEENEEDQAEKF